MKLSNANQPTACTRNVHHVYITCQDARTMYSPLTIMFCVCKFVTHACVNLHGCSVCTLVYVCVMKCINEMCVSCSGMCLC